MGSTMCTLPEIVYNTNLCFACPQYSLVLIECIPAYLGIKRDQFFRLMKNTSAVILCPNWYTTICILDTYLYPNVSEFTYEIVGNKLVHINLYILHTNWYILICYKQIKIYQFVWKIYKLICTNFLPTILSGEFGHIQTQICIQNTNCSIWVCT